MEQGVDSVTTVSLDGAASSVLGVLCDDRTIFSEKRVRLCDFDGLVQTFASGLDNADRVRVGQGLVADVVGLVDVAVETAVVKGNIDVDNVSVLEDTLIGNTVTDGFVD